MNCLLVAPIPDNPRGIYTISIGMPFISSAMKHVPGLNVVCLNLNSKKYTDEEAVSKVISVIEDEKIEAVFSGGAVTHYKSIRLIFETAKRYNPALVTVTGGPVITGDPAIGMAAIKFADYGIIGEGERTVTELSLALKNRSDISKVRGLIIPKSPSSPHVISSSVHNNYIYTGEREPIMDWKKEIFWPDYENFGLSEFLRAKATATSAYFDHVLSIHTSRGCPFKCTFCCNPVGKAFRERPLDDFFNELDYLLAKGHNLFDMPDSLLATSHERFKAFCDGMRKRGVRPWRTQLKVTQINNELINMLQKAGCTSVIVGLESASNKILKSMNKNITIEQIEHALKLLYNAGMNATGNFIFGDKEETTETVRETMNWWESHPQYSINLNLITLYPGTDLYKYALAQGKIDPMHHFLNDFPLTNISKMSDEEYTQLIDMVSRKRKERSIGPEQSNYHLKNMRIELDFKVNEKTVTGICPHCGAETDLRLSFFDEEVLCLNCLSPLYMPPPDFVLDSEKLKQGLHLVLEKYGAVGFYGIGRFFRLHVSTEISDLAGVYLFDREPGAVYGNKAVEPVENIKIHALKYMIIGVTPLSLYMAEIKKEIEGFSCVEKIRNLYQLMSVDALF